MLAGTSSRTSPTSSALLRRGRAIRDTGRRLSPRHATPTDRDRELATIPGRPPPRSTSSRSGAPYGRCPFATEIHRSRCRSGSSLRAIGPPCWHIRRKGVSHTGGLSVSRSRLGSATADQAAGAHESSTASASRDAGGAGARSSGESGFVASRPSPARSRPAPVLRGDIPGRGGAARGLAPERAARCRWSSGPVQLS